MTSSTINLHVRVNNYNTFIEYEIIKTKILKTGYVFN